MIKITGRVVHGNKIGRGLGYPTANIPVAADLDIADGVYAARVWLDGGKYNDSKHNDSEHNDGEPGKRYGAMANLGVKPTFSDNGRRILELHLFDFKGNLYGLELTAELMEFIRPEQRFESPDALRTQIAKDEKQIKHILKCI